MKYLYPAFTTWNSQTENHCGSTIYFCVFIRRVLLFWIVRDSMMNFRRISQWPVSVQTWKLVPKCAEFQLATDTNRYFRESHWLRWMYLSVVDLLRMQRIPKSMTKIRRISIQIVSLNRAPCLMKKLIESIINRKLFLIKTFGPFNWSKWNIAQNIIQTM